MDRIYPSSKFVVYVNVAIAPFLALVLIAFIIYGSFEYADRTGSRMPVWPIALVSILFLGILAPIGYVSLKIASQIRVKDDSSIEFRGPWLRSSLDPSMIISVRASPWMRNSWVNVKHTRGKLLLYTPIDGFYEFLGWLKGKNPSVEIKWL